MCLINIKWKNKYQICKITSHSESDINTNVKPVTRVSCSHTHTHRWINILFSRIRELVLSAAVVGLLDPRVRPQTFDSCNVRLIKPSDLLNVHFLHQHGVRLRRK